MNKATKAFRRSSVRLKSFSCGHSELNLIVSDMKEVRSAAKQFADAQETVWKDLSKWASKERNEAIRESFSYLIELNRLWTEVQNDFIEQLNKFKYAFEMILEGEMSVDKLREHLSVCEARETKLKKDLQKGSKKSVAEVVQIEQRIEDTRSSIKSTQIEITERAHENEAVKVIRLKEGLLKLSESYIDLAYKSSIIFDGKKSVVSHLPEVEQSRGMHDVRYRGAEQAKLKVAQVKESVKTYKQPTQVQPGAPPPVRLEQPPPYALCTHAQPPPHAYYPPNYYHSVGWGPRYAQGATNGGRYDMPPPDDYEQDIAGAVGGARI